MERAAKRARKGNSSMNAHASFISPNLADGRLARRAPYRMLIGGRSVDAASSS